jgi:hypothetical protein
MPAHPPYSRSVCLLPISYTRYVWPMGRPVLVAGTVDAKQQRRRTRGDLFQHAGQGLIILHNKVLSLVPSLALTARSASRGDSTWVDANASIRTPDFSERYASRAVETRWNGRHASLSSGKRIGILSLGTASFVISAVFDEAHWSFCPSLFTIKLKRHARHTVTGPSNSLHPQLLSEKPRAW